METEITITRELANDIIFHNYKDHPTYQSDVDRCLKIWGMIEAETMGDFRRQLDQLPNDQTEYLLLKIKP